MWLPVNAPLPLPAVLRSKKFELSSGLSEHFEV
jgi:hypothetical protein